jgi:tRNA-specific 2-thiouridylase
MSKGKRVLMAMSGGLDSSVAAILLQQQGYEVIGITMKLWTSKDAFQQSACCDNEAINDARDLAVKLDIPHYVLDFTELFKEIVVGNFIDEYLHARTPNPCILCNINLKWKALIKKAEELHCDFIATGHYAVIKHENQRYFISKGKDSNKDQSYVLWGLPQEHLKKTIFPLGAYSKTEIRQMALDMGFERIANKRESYDICFIPDNDYRTFLQTHVENLEQKCPTGNFVDTSGTVLGEHKGFPFYTIGQRKGLVIALGTPKYVCKINAQTNEITLGDKEDLLSDSLLIRNYNLGKYANIPNGFMGETKIRYKDKGEKAFITQYEDYISIQFQTPVSAITPGQSAVIYEHDDVIVGGIIDLV